MLIGLTGLYCAGKNHVASILQRRGLQILDVDRLGYIAIENKKADIIARFGGEIADPDGSVNRRQLGTKVFRHEKEVADLEAIVHPEANRLTEEWIALQCGKNCVINAALLHRSSVFQQLDCIILVHAPLLLRLIRAKKRDGLPWAAIARRLLSQRQFSAQYLSKNADIYRVENPGFGANLEDQIDIILSKLGLKSSIVEGGS